MDPVRYPINELAIYRHAPEKPGVYVLHDAFCRFYIGYSGNIRRALLHHMRGDSINRLTFDPSEFSFEVDPAALVIRRRRRIGSQVASAQRDLNR